MILELFENTGSFLNKLAGAPPNNSLLKDTIPINDSFSKGKYTDYFIDSSNLSFIGGSQTTSPPTLETYFLLQENSSYLLQEDESYLI